MRLVPVLCAILLAVAFPSGALAGVTTANDVVVRRILPDPLVALFLGVLFPLAVISYIFERFGGRL